MEHGAWGMEHGDKGIKVQRSAFRLVFDYL